MKRLVLVTASLVALAACHSKPSVDLNNAKPKDVASAVDAAGGTAGFVRPGRWQTTFTMEKMSMPGMPAAVAEQMQKTMNRVETSASCLTEADVKKPKAEFFAGAQKDCTYKHFTMAGGSIDTEMECKNGGATMTMAIKGTYSPDHYSAHTTMTGSGMGMAAGKGMTMEASVDSKRVGECTKS